MWPRQNQALLLHAALFLLLSGCDGCGQTAASAPANPPARGGSVPSSSTPSMTALRVPAAQTHEVSDLGAGERRPLLIFLHGLGSSGRAAFDGMQLAELGARERVFVLAPDGTRDSQRRRFWNAGAACCNFDQLAVDDVARLSALIDTWRAHPHVDPTRIYVMGHSNGGFMTERLVCALDGRIAAAVSLAGAAPPVELPCSLRGPIALLEVHGDADPIVRYEGGSVFDSPLLAKYPGIQQGFRDWSKRLGCAGSAEPGPDLDLEEQLVGAETTVAEYRQCRSGSAALWTVRGGNHSAGTSPRALEAIWRFLAAHHT
jgi:polyhydroxybutyrate depolymerase